LGGEPFAQPDGLLPLVRELREQGCPHHLFSSKGYIVPKHCAKKPRVNCQSPEFLDEIDI